MSAMRTLIALTIIAIVPMPSWACSWGGVAPRDSELDSQDWTLVQALDRSPIILIGRVLAVNPTEDLARVLVDRPLKGATPQDFWLSGFAFDGLVSSPSCFYKRLSRVEVGWTYLMF